MKAKPIYSEKMNVFHNNINCTERNNIERNNIKHGTGGKVLCKRCEKLNKELNRKS